MEDETGKTSAPARYNRPGRRETLDRIRLLLTPEEFVGFCLGNAVKYRERAGLKGDAATDIEKAKFYEQAARHSVGLGPDPRERRAGWMPPAPEDFYEEARAMDARGEHATVIAIAREARAAISRGLQASFARDRGPEPRLAAPAALRWATRPARIGGEPPAPRLGMVVQYSHGASRWVVVVTHVPARDRDIPHSWHDVIGLGIVEAIYDMVGGPLLWAREPGMPQWHER